MRRSISICALCAVWLAGPIADADQAPGASVVQPVPPASIARPAPPSATAQPEPTGSAGAPAPPAALAHPAPPAATVETVPPEAAEQILGQKVSDRKGDDVGRLVDVLVDADGVPQAAVIDFGGFMGVGNRKVAVHWSALRFAPADPRHKIVLEMTQDEIKGAPEVRSATKAAPVVTPTDADPSSP